MPAKSAAQQKAAGAGLAAKRGETSPSSLKGAKKEMYRSMSEQELEEFASTERKESLSTSRNRGRTPEIATRTLDQDDALEWLCSRISVPAMMASHPS